MCIKKDRKTNIMCEVIILKTPTDKEYEALSDSMAKKSPIVTDCLFAFLTGGAICALGEVLSQVYKNAGAEEKTAGSLVAITLILLSAVLTASGVYDKIAKFGGAGTLVPITGFANSIVSPAMEFRPEGWILGVGVKIFSIAGPVLSYGGLTSFICGIIYYVLEVAL